MRPLQELRAVAALLVSRPGAEVPAATAAGLAWLPIVGAAMGSLAVVAGWTFGALGDVVASVAAVTALTASWWRLRSATLGVLPTVLGALAEATVAASMPAPARTMALLLAPVFACWAMVVQCYGGASVDRADAWSALVGRVRFREFAWASVVALGWALVALDAVGLFVAIVSATVMLVVRGAAYRTGGMRARHVVATGLLVEGAVLLVLAAIVRLTA